MIRRWWRLQRLRAREYHLTWQLDLWPNPDMENVLSYVRYARQQAETGRSYPPTRDGSR